MKWNLSKLIVFSALVSLSSSQFWDLSFWGDEDEGNDTNEEEEEDNGDMWVFEEEENLMKLIKMSTSQIHEEKQLLEESSELIVNEITRELRDDLIEANMNQISEIISDRTVELFNVLHAIRNHEEDEKKLKDWKLNVNDIFIWNNDSVDKINELIESYYNLS